jgi:hypothetical protein
VADELLCCGAASMNESDWPVEERQQHLELVSLFLKRTLNDVELLRRRIPALVCGNKGTWDDLRSFAGRTAKTSEALGFGVLSQCGLELARLTREQEADRRLDATYLLHVASAIENVALEVHTRIVALD